MSRFLTATRRVDLGECRCPGTPHEGDWAELRVATPWGALLEAGEADGPRAMYATLALGTIVGWNLLDGDPPEPVPVTAEAIGLLDAQTFELLTRHINEAVEAGNLLPNASGATSRRSRPASAVSPLRKTTTP